MSTFQMLWDCPQCGTAGLLGLDHRFCPGCGAPQDPEARYFPTEAQKRAVEGAVPAVADRSCPSCGTPNAASAAFCAACGASTEGGVEVARRERTLAGQADSAAAAKEEHRARRQAAEQARVAAMAGAPEAPAEEAVDPVAEWKALRGRARRRTLAVALAAAAVALVAAVGFWAFSLRETVEVVVSGHAWERTITVEALQAVRESGWDEEVPADARERRCERRERGSQQVASGESCRTERVDHGNGTFSEVERCSPVTRSAPSYDQHCEWIVDRWRTVRTAEARGGLADPPRWPEPRLGPDEREGDRHRSDQVTFLVSARALRSCEVPVSRWPSLPVGSAWTVEAGLLTGGLHCDTLQPR